MSNKLSVMVQDVYLAVDADQEPLTVNDIMDRAVSVRPLTVEAPPTRRTWVVPVTVAGLAAVAVLIVVGLVPFLTITVGDAEPAATTVPAPQPEPGQGERLEFNRVNRDGGIDLFNTSNPVWFDGYLYMTKASGHRMRSSDGIKWSYKERGDEWPPDTQADWPDLWEGKVLIEGEGLVDRDTGETIVPEEAVAGMDVMFSEFGMVGISTYDPQQLSGTIDAVFSADGTTWARWSLDLTTETSVEVVGIGDGFVVLGEWYSHGFWVADLP
jgi:hypothetical protein